MLFHYGDPFYQDFAAVTRKKTGRGCMYYIGCGLEEKLTRQLMDCIMKKNEICPIPSADGVEIVERGSGVDKITIYINHNATNQKVNDLELAPFECKIVK